MKLHPPKSHFHFSFIFILEKRDRELSISTSHQCDRDSFAYVISPEGSRCKYTAVIISTIRL